MKHPTYTNFTKWFEVKANSLFKETLQNIFESMDEQVQLHNKGYSTDKHNIPIDYLEYQIEHHFQRLKHRLLEHTIFKACGTNFTFKNKSPINKPVMLNNDNSMLQLAMLARSAHHLESLPQLAFLDIETDSVRVDTANILQVAIIKPIIDPTHESLHHFKSWVEYVSPYTGYTKEQNTAYEINKIGNKQLASAKPMRELSSIISEQLKNTIIVGYNCNSFDIPILKRHLEANDSQLLHKFSIDLYPACWKDKKQNLAAALDAYNIQQNPNPHDAKADASCCIDLLFELINNNILPPNEEELVTLFITQNNTWRSKNLKVVEINPIFFRDDPSSKLPIRNTLKRRYSQITESISSFTESIPKRTSPNV